MIPSSTPNFRSLTSRTLPTLLSSRPPHSHGVFVGPHAKAECDSANDPDPSLSLPGWKRAIDILLALLILPLVILFGGIVYCWIQLVSPGPILFTQSRIGRSGKPFKIYKFRSMKLEAETDIHESHVEHLMRTNVPMAKLDMKGDPRLIKGGALIRTSGIDELPQLFNVLRGEMSLVGPRPCLPKEFELYDADQRRRFAVQPGMTGLWQVSRTHSTTFSEMVRMDDQYVDNVTMLSDMNIMLRTPIKLVGQISDCVGSKARKAAKRSRRLRAVRRRANLAPRI